MSKRSFIPDASSGENKKKRRALVFDEKTGERVHGVRTNLSGNRFIATIRVPSTGKDIWIGTFDTVQEASEAYQAKKKEFELLKIPRDSDRKFLVFDDKSGERIAGVWKTRSNRYYSKICDPITWKDMYLGTFDTIQQASEAYSAKKREIEAAKGVREIDKMDRRVLDEMTGERIAGVWRAATSNRYNTRIYDPVLKRHVHVGTFGTVQQASQAYQAKKKEFEAARMRRTGEFEWAEAEVSNTKSSEFVSNSEENQEPMEEEALESCSDDNFRVSNSLESTCDHVEILVQKENKLDHVSRKTQTTSEPSYENENVHPKLTQQPLSSPPGHTETVKTASGKSSKEAVSLMASFEDLQKKSVWVTSDKYRGSGALGFLIPTKGGGESFMPFMDNHGFLLGEFSQVDDFLSLSHV